MRAGDNDSDKRTRGGVLTPVRPHPADDTWSRIGVGLRVLLGDAVAEPLPSEMLQALNRLDRVEAEQAGHAGQDQQAGQAPGQPTGQAGGQAAGQCGQPHPETGRRSDH